MIFDRVKREYLGERRGRRWMVVAWLSRENGWKSGSPSADGGALFQREKSIFMRDLLSWRGLSLRATGLAIKR